MKTSSDSSASCTTDNVCVQPTSLRYGILDEEWKRCVSAVTMVVHGASSSSRSPSSMEFSPRCLISEIWWKLAESFATVFLVRATSSPLCHDVSERISGLSYRRLSAERRHSCGVASTVQLGRNSPMQIRPPRVATESDTLGGEACVIRPALKPSFWDNAPVGSANSDKTSYRACHILVSLQYRSSTHACRRWQPLAATGSHLKG